MANEVVHKASHCAWQIHYHIVFPVKYWHALVDEDVVKITTETAAEIGERYAIEFERRGAIETLSPYCVRHTLRWHRGKL